MSTMTDTPQRNMPMTPAPVPLFSGNALTTPDGAEHPVQSVTVTITADDGTQQSIDLEFRFGGWWAPVS